MPQKHNPVHNVLSNCLICMGGASTLEITAACESEPFALECNIEYFTDVMQELQGSLQRFEEYTFVFTRSVDELPAKFDLTPNLVVFVMGDEWARVPVYADRVHAVFKAPGQHMKLATHYGWQRFNLMTSVQYLRQQLKRFPRYHRDRSKNIFAIPYGYYRLPKRTTVTPINERSLDASFTGSIDHKNALGGLVKTAKVLSRERMVRVVQNWKTGKRFNIDVKLSSYFPKAKDKPEHDDYPQVLMDTKICLSPRGTHLETYRLCEGMYYGCVVIAEEQPEHWFAEDSPAIIIKDWNTLPALLDELLENPAQLDKLQQASLAYWDSTLSPVAVSGYITKALATLTPTLAANDGSAAQSVQEFRHAG